MTRILSLFVMFMLFGVLAFAQNRVVTGTVTDEKGNAVDAASVRIKGTSLGATTDPNGSYRLNNVKPGAVLTISSVEVESQDVTVPPVGPVNVSVTRKSSSLTAVTVVTTALGIKKQPRELGYAASTITNRTINAGKATGVAQAMNGKLSSVSISTTNSGVFENSTIRIRGIRSLTGDNNPMLVVDGAPTPLSYLSSIAPEDISTQTVLKGATAAAIYGPEAANGVIIITTRRGTGDGSLSVSVTSAIQFTKVAFFPRLQHEFGQGAGEIINPDGSYAYIPYENQLYGPAFDGSTQDIGIRLADGSIQSGPYSNKYAGDKKSFYNTGTTQQNNVSISGKDFFLSIDDAIIHGTVPGDKNRRTGFRFNGSKTSNKFSANYGINYVLQNYNVLDEGSLAGFNTTAYTGGLFSLILQTADNVPLLQYKDWQNNKYAQPSNYYNEYAMNPYWAIGNLRQIGRSDQILGNVDLNYQFAPWLKATLKASTDLTFSNFENDDAPLTQTSFGHTRTPSTFFDKLGQTFTGNTNSNRVNFDGFVSGETGVSKNFRIGYIAGGEVRQNRSKSIAIGGNNLVVPYLYNVDIRSGDANVPNGNNSFVQTRSYSLYGQVDLKFRNYAFVTFTGRNDWDSRLLPKNRIFFYPGVNASLIVTDDHNTSLAPSLHNNVINYLKLRGSYTKSGNVNLGAYRTQPTYSQVGGSPYGSNVGFTANDNAPDPNLTPEFQYASEGGFDLGLLKNNRIYLVASYYNSDNKQQILTVNKPLSTGYSSTLSNVAEFKNYGMDVDLTLSPLIKVGNARFDINLNAGYNNNRIISLYQGLPISLAGTGNFQSAINGSPTVNNYAQVGGPAYQFQLTDYNRDSQGRVIVDATTGMPTKASALSIRGRSLPLWVIGATPSVSVGNFSLSTTWDFKGGHDSYSGLGPDEDFSGISYRSAQYGRQNFLFPNSVISDGHGGYVPNTNVITEDGNYGFWVGAGSNTAIGTNYFFSAAALRLREVNLSYTLPVNGKGLKSLTFSIVGRNLLLFVPKSNQYGDPEFNSGAQNTAGIASAFQSPATRLFGMSVRAQF